MTNTTPAPATTSAPVYVDQTWHDVDVYEMVGSRSYRATDDRRLLAIVERVSTDTAPDGDVYAPAYSAAYRGWSWDLSRVGSGFDDDDAREAVERAWSRWGRAHETAARFLRVFHGITVHEVHGPSQGDLLVILDTPAHREHVGDTEDRPSVERLAGDLQTWRAYVDGDVYAVGYAVNPLRTSHDAPVDLDDDDDWTVELVSHGHYGDDWAHEAALELDGAPDADELDALTTAAVEAMTEAAARDEAPAAVRELVEQYDAHMSAWTAAHGDGDEVEGTDGEPTSSDYERHDDVRLNLLDALVEAARPLTR